MKRATGPTATGREGKTVYCVCRKSHENGFMIACDVCDEWFHGKCVNISAAQGRRMEKYVCPKCSERRAAPRQSTTPDEEKEDEEGEEGGGDENENENGDGSQGDDEPLFSDEDSDGWKEEEAYIKTPWYDPETDEVDLEEWKKAIAEAGDLQQEGAALGGQEDTLKQGDETLAGGEEMEVTDYSARKRRFSASSSTGLRRREGNGVKRKRISAEDVGEKDKAREEKGARDEHYQGCDEATRAVRERVVTSLAEAMSMPRQESTERPDAAVALELARSIEKEMWNMFERQTNSAYKAKFRTLLFNLKDERNQGLRDSMLSGEMTPAELCKKTSKELAPLELAEWRKQRAEKYFSENVMITEELGPIVKKTHKGEEILHTAPAIPPPPSHQDTKPTGAVPSASPPTLPSDKSPTPVSSPATPQTRRNKGSPRLTEENGNKQREDTQEGAMMDESEDTNGMPTIDIRVDVSTPINEEEILSKAVPTSKPTPAKLAKSRVNENNASSRPPSSTITSPPRSTSTKPSSNEVSGTLVWRGALVKSNIQRFDVVAHHLVGPHNTSMQQLLPEELQLQGRVALSKLAKYMTGLSASRHRIHSLFVLEPADSASSVAYVAMINYFGTKNRAGVVANVQGAIKEMYVVPITSDDVHFRDMLHLEEDKLLAVLVTDKDLDRP